MRRIFAMAGSRIVAVAWSGIPINSWYKPGRKGPAFMSIHKKFVRRNFTTAGSKIAVFAGSGSCKLNWRCRPALVQRALGSSGQVCSRLVDLRQGGRELCAHALQLGKSVGDMHRDSIDLGRARGGDHLQHVARMVA